MNSMIRLLGLVNRTPPANPMAALEDIFDLLQNEEVADVIVLPRLALCPPSSGALLESKALREVCEEALLGLMVRSQSIESFIVFTTLFFENSIPEERTVIIYRGERFEAGGEGAAALFKIGGLPVCVMPETPAALPRRIPEIIQSGCQLVICPCYEPVYAGSLDRVQRAVECVSAATGCAVMVLGGGVGDTSSPFLYGGFALVCENGMAPTFRLAGLESVTLAYDLDVDLLPAPEQMPNVPFLCERPCAASCTGMLRTVSTTPYLPDDETALAGYLGEIFALQCRSLAARLDNAGLKGTVLGVSGGLDSTLALLVCAGACDLLGMPRERILGVTMPGFGTCDRTYYNALQLMEQLGVKTRDIPIRNAVSSHFEDIGHNPALQDATYENAQARERSQILFDLSNQQGGLLVVGTGDLTENALGWCTFGGDHLAGYNVNITLNKTVIRALVRHIAESGVIEGVCETLLDILDTPVSPELLPPDEGGEIHQKSEDILGPYLLHDFYLYHTLAHQLAPKKLLGYALIAFAGVYEADVIKSTLKTFLKRFYTAQFKRACQPDSADLCRPNLNFYHIPSDVSPQLFLAQLD